LELLAVGEVDYESFFPCQDALLFVADGVADVFGLEQDVFEPVLDGLFAVDFAFGFGCSAH
jgi:hypothetical protein